MRARLSTLPRVERREERGIALVMVIVLLLVLGVLATLTISQVDVETKIHGHGLRDERSLNLAQAGVAEALSRIKSGDIALDPTTPTQVAQIFLTTSLPSVGADTAAYATAQPVGEYLSYSTASKSGDVLTVELKTNAARSIAYRYDPAQTPSLNLSAGLPVYRLSVTGVVSQNRSRILTEVSLQPFQLGLNAAVTAGGPVVYNSSATICGYSHPLGLTIADASAHASSHNGIGDVPAHWTTSTVGGGALTQTGSPVSALTSQSGFYDGPWDVLGLTSNEFTTLMGAGTSALSTYDGLLNLDNDATPSNRSGVFSVPGGTGEGLLYVDGDLTLTGPLAFRGLVYVEGNLLANGSLDIVGALVVRGQSSGNALTCNGATRVSYARDVVNESMARYRGKFETLSWRELH